MPRTYLETGNRTDPRIILAHGAGAPMDSSFMEFFANQLGDAGFHTIRFEFPYMQERRDSGKKRPPNGQSVLLECWRNVVADWGAADNVYIGGKSMGGRMASLVADELEVKGLICLGYPFYAPGKMDRPRTEHLEKLKTRTLIVQGDRDSMGNREAVSGYTLSSAIQLEWMPDGDHGFKPRKSSGTTEEENWDLAVRKICKFVQG